jgi:hypothetical protein
LNLMSVRFTQLAVVSLLAGAATLQAADDEASVKLTGVAEFENQRYALMEIVSRPGRPVIKPILAPGERVEGVEVKEIDVRSGRVRVVINDVETFYLVGNGEPAATPRTFHFKSADLMQVLEIYQVVSDRTVLRPPNLPGTKIDLQTERLSSTEALRALDQLLLAKAIVTRPRGDKFVFVVQSDQTNRLSLIPDPPAVAQGVEVLPAGLIKFWDAHVSQVLEICQELSGRTLLKPSNLPAAKIGVRSQTDMTRDQGIWMLDAVLALADIAMIPHGDKFAFVLPGIENPRVPAVEPPALSPTVNAQEVLPPGLLKFQDADISQVLTVYASLVARKPLPVERTTPPVKMSVRTQTSLTRAEAVSALDTIAALNRLQFVLVGDDEVKVIPAALARRETNPVQ